MIRAVIDSCIVFGMPLCDTMLRAAEANLYQIVLSQKIIEDATRNMVLKGRLKLEKEAYYQQQIQNAFAANFFDAPPEIVAAMTNPETDRHVAATAIVGQAQYIVTFNLKDFPAKSLLAHNIEAIHPDQFLELLCDEWGESRLYEVVYQQSNTLKNPRISLEALLDKLAIQKCLRFRSRLIEYQKNSQG